MADGDERGSCCGWAAVGDDGPDLAGDVQHGGADAADTACFEVGEGSAVVVKEDSAGAGVGGRQPATWAVMVSVSSV